MRSMKERERRKDKAGDKAPLGQRRQKLTSLSRKPAMQRINVQIFVPNNNSVKSIILYILSGFCLICDSMNVIESN